MENHDWTMDDDWVPEPQTMPYWRWLCEANEAAVLERDAVPHPTVERLCGELLAAMLDRLKTAGIPTDGTVAAFAELAAALRGYEAQIDSRIRGMTGGERLTAEDAERIGQFAHAKTLIERVERLAVLLAECEPEGCAELRALSGGLLHDLPRLRQDFEGFGFDPAPLLSGWAGVQAAVRLLLSAYKDYLLRTYTDYFDPATPTSPAQLGGMLIGAAVLDGIAGLALDPAGSRHRIGDGLPLPIEAGSYRTLLDWFDDYDHYDAIGGPDE